MQAIARHSFVDITHVSTLLQQAAQFEKVTEEERTARGLTDIFALRKKHDSKIERTRYTSTKLAIAAHDRASTAASAFFESLPVEARPPALQAWIVQENVVMVTWKLFVEGRRASISL